MLLLSVVYSHSALFILDAAPASKYQIHSPYNGKEIGKISVIIRPVFEGDDIGWFYKAVNTLKFETKERVVRRELFIKEGQQYDEFLVRESKRSLRTLSFLRKIDHEVIPNGNKVDIIIYAQDAWTLVPRAGASRASGRSSSSIGMEESNILGFGKRIQIQRSQIEDQTQLEGLWEDPRILGTFKRFRAQYSDRSDGERIAFLLDKPFRSLLNRSSWEINFQDSDVVGRLFEDGEESFIFSTKQTFFRAQFTQALGDPKVLLRRISVGLEVQRNGFTQASERDFEALDIDPEDVSTDPSLLAEDRKFHGLTIGYQSISPDFIALNYIDRFDRVEDYNLGAERSFRLMIAPEALGSSGNVLSFSATRSGGIRFAEKEFLRAEVGFSTRLNNREFENSLLRAEARYYNVLGDVFLRQLFLGRHTFALHGFIDVAEYLDRDTQLEIGNKTGALRGYRSRAFTGNKRFAINVEQRVHLVDDIARLVSLGAAAFIDIGGAVDGEVTDLFQEQIYSDVGVGLRLGFPRSSGGGVVRFEFAVPLRDADDGTMALEPRIMFTSGQAFSARNRSESRGVEAANTVRSFDN